MNTPRTTLKYTCEEVIHIRHWTNTLFSVRITRPPHFRFTPGQFARLSLSHRDGTTISRAYSIVSSPKDDFLEFFLILVPGGALSTLFETLTPGAPILLDKFSYGFMTIDRFIDGKILWMLATGTGLGPFLSILKDIAVWKKFQHIVVVHTVRHAKELVYQDILSIQRNGFHYIGATTRDRNVHPPATVQGRVTTLLTQGILEKITDLTILPNTSRFMLCGNPQMIDQMRNLLRERGFHPCRRAVPGQFVTEDYW